VALFALKNAEPVYYVYLLIDPRDGKPFYVGKGKGRRAKIHLQDWQAGRICNVAKHERISEIAAAGYKPVVEIVASRMSEKEALRLEQEKIRSVGGCNLTNAQCNNQTSLERYIALTKLNLKQLKPFDVWIDERPRNEWEINMFLRIKSELEGFVALLEGPHGKIANEIYNAAA